MISKINAILNYVEEKDVLLYRHLEETGIYSYAVAKSLNLNKNIREEAYCVGLLHDIGKLESPFAILKTIDKEFSQEEKEDIGRHVFYGSKFVKMVDGIEHLHDAIKYHHEHWDGTGYPEQLKGEAIPLVSRIVFIACSYHGMRIEQNMTHEEAISELRKYVGVKFDPKMVEPFIYIVEKEELF